MIYLNSGTSVTVVRSYFYSNTPDDINSNDDNSNFASTCCGGGACDADAHCSQISSDNFKGSGGKPYSCNCLGAPTPLPTPAPTPLPVPAPTPQPTYQSCGACDATTCATELCSDTDVYTCTAGSPAGGCSADRLFWPSREDCDSCCVITSCRTCPADGADIDGDETYDEYGGLTFFGANPQFSYFGRSWSVVNTGAAATAPTAWR